MTEPSPFPNEPQGIMVIGIGNEFRGDDGCGRAVARELLANSEFAVWIHESDGDPTQLLDLWHAERLVIVVDATRTGAEPGSILRIEVEENVSFPSSTFASTHGFSLAEAIALGRSLRQLPSRLVIYGIEAERTEMGNTMTRPVALAVSVVAARIRDELEQALRSIPPRIQGGGSRA